MGLSGTNADGNGIAEGRLSARQRQCLTLVAEGYTSKQIARELKLSPSTVDNHLRAALERLGLHSRAAAARAFRSSSAAVQPLDGADDAGAETAAEIDAPEPAVPLLSAALRLPPVGGKENKLSLSRRYFHVLQIALLGTMVMAAVIMTIAGLVQLFSR